MTSLAAEQSKRDQEYMALAIQLAKQGLYTTSPNPRVGCVLVKNDEIIGQGFHVTAGQGHAEVNALADANERGNLTKGATAYVTLEPCSHFGRTPPCAQALIHAQVARVVGAMTDPNPQVAGNGFNMLRAAGIEVVDNCLAADSAKLNPGFIKRMSLVGANQQALPYVRLKMATSLDGRTAMQSGESQWITGPEARAEVQKIRAQSCAIICGADSVLIDDPAMNVRIQAESASDNDEIRQPLRIIMDSRHRVPATANIFTHPGKVMIVSPHKPERAIKSELSEVSYWQTQSSDSENDKQQVELTRLLEDLANQGINEVLVETGAQLAGAFIEQDLVDELILFTAPTLLGSDARPAFSLPFAKMDQQIRWHWQDVRMVGNDLKLVLKSQSSSNEKI